MAKMEWETIGDNGEARAKVFGGWLVKTYDYKAHFALQPDGYDLVRDGIDWYPTMAFVPDAKHEWKIESEEKQISIDRRLHINKALSKAIHRYVGESQEDITCVEDELKRFSFTSILLDGFVLNRFDGEYDVIRKDVFTLECDYEIPLIVMEYYEQYKKEEEKQNVY